MLVPYGHALAFRNTWPTTGNLVVHVVLALSIVVDTRVYLALGVSTTRSSRSRNPRRFTGRVAGSGSNTSVLVIEIVLKGLSESGKYDTSIIIKPKG